MFEDAKNIFNVILSILFLLSSAFGFAYEGHTEKFIIVSFLFITYWILVISVYSQIKKNEQSKKRLFFLKNILLLTPIVIFISLMIIDVMKAVYENKKIEENCKIVSITNEGKRKHYECNDGRSFMLQDIEIDN